MPPRSTAGCYTCKRRKKKCDETQPNCLRCIRSGKECEGYAPLENPDNRGIMRRGRVAPVPRPQPSSTPDSPEDQFGSNSLSSTSTSDQRNLSDPPMPPPKPDPVFPQRPSAAGSGPLPPSKVIWSPNATIPPLSPPLEELPTGLPAPAFTPLDPGMGVSPLLPYSSRIFEPPTWTNSPGHGQLMGPNLPYASISEVKEEDEDLDDDLSGPKQEMYTAPIPDRNNTDNTLPFILQCYARWAKLVVYQPDKGLEPLKQGIVHKFVHAPDERPRIILLANAVGSLGKSLRPGPRAASLVTYLRTEAYNVIDKFISSTPSSDREMDMQQALDALDLLMEVVLIQRYSNSMLTIVKLMEAAAPIFRRACPEPMDQYVNLPGAILSSSINIRHFATTDVIMSITTGRPMIFRYDTAYTPGFFELVRGGFGMQWLHGIADQYIVILAHINVLAEELERGATADPQLVAEIENQIREVELSTERPTDPVATIWKFTVRECWRLTMNIYLYMVLCRATTDDRRVLKSVKTYVRLMEAVKPGRNPDSFLYIPLIIVGASAYRKHDRAVIHRRMLGLQECINPGSCGYDALNMLIDLWMRMEAEGRPSLWTDFRMSAFRITGI